MTATLSSISGAISSEMSVLSFLSLISTVSSPLPHTNKVHMPLQSVDQFIFVKQATAKMQSDVVSQFVAKSMFIDGSLFVAGPQFAVVLQPAVNTQLFFKPQLVTSSRIAVETPVTD